MQPTQFSPDTLAASLRAIRRHGDFYTSGTFDIAPPNLTVQGMGLLSLPFQQSQLAPLLAHAEQAPFGRGEETLIDATVRRTWQIDAGALSFAGKQWQTSLDAIVALAADGLGVEEPVRAELYKLLVYETGDFFVAHRDTEKAPGMFATLMLILPSIYSGGELLVHHGEQTVRLDLAGTDPGSAAFAAFYADCVHEVLPVTAGARLALVYNLIRSGGKGLLVAPEHGAEVAAVAELLRGWIAAQDAGDAPAKLVYPLDHAYSLAELDVATLKNVDAAVAQVLTAAAAEAGCELHLAVLEIEESGSAEGDYYGDENEDSDYDVIDVIDYDATLSAWRRTDGTALPLGTVPLLDDELCPAGAFDDAEPDTSHFHEATGNEGATFERAYRRAALVVWPRNRRLAIIGAAPLAASLPYLDATVNVGNTQDAAALAGHMVRNWSSAYAHDGKLAARLLTHLVCLQHIALIDTYLEHIAATGHFRADEAAILGGAALLLAPERMATLIGAVVAANVSVVPGACATLIDTVCRAGSDARRHLAPAVQRLTEALLGRCPSPRAPGDLRQTADVDAAAIVAVLAALREAGMVDQTDTLVAHWLATCSLDDVLVEAARAVAKDPALGRYGPAGRLRAQVLACIGQRIALPLVAPADWRRASQLSCACSYCVQLAQFLDDPSHKCWTLRVGEQHRHHVETTIRRDQCDVDCTTVRQGRPYGLLCTKNQASHDARCRQRAADLVLARQLAR